MTPDLWWLLPLLFALLEGVICGATGVLLLTQRRLLQANLIAHGVLPGLALALALKLDPAIGGWLSGLAAALVAERLIRTQQRQQDAVINTVLAGSLAVGVLLLSLLRLQVELEPLLFGDLLLAGWRDLLQTLLAGGVGWVFLASHYRQLVFSGVDPDGAEAAGIRLEHLHTLLALVTTLVIVSAIAAVGVILVIGLLCAPAVVATRRAGSLWNATGQAALIGASASVGGYGMALGLDLPPGPVIGLLCLAILLVPAKVSA